MSEDKKALFGEEDRVKISLVKEAGAVTFQRGIGASTLEAAAKGLTVLVAHLAELSGISVGVLMGYMARVLMEEQSEGPGDCEPAGEYPASNRAKRGS